MLKWDRGQLGKVAILGMLLVLFALAGWQIRNEAAGSGPRPLAASGMPVGDKTGTAADTGLVSTGDNGMLVGYSSKNDVSPPLRDMKPLPPSSARTQDADSSNPPIQLVGHKDEADGALQSTFGPLGPLAMPTPITSWDGIKSQGAGGGGCNCAPPDTNGDVGPNHYVQTVNSSFQIWNKTGGSLYGPANINTIWSGFGGACATRNDGDPIVLHDQLADRWLISQFTAAAPYHECIAISTTADPTGTWNRYAFQLSTTNFPDYPHFGIWPDGYYMSVNQFNNGSTYAGPRPYVFNRSAMLAGTAASFQTTSAALGSSVAPIMPADLDGSTLPTAGAPNPFVGFGSTMKVYKYHVDWANPASSTWTTSASLATAGFTQLCATGRNCIKQPGTNQKLDGIGDRLMNRLAYRKFATYDSLVVTHNVKAGGNNNAPTAGVRWYEIRNPITSPAIYQQGTYAPDSNSRWMGSAAQDKNGNIAVGYSASSGSVYPSIRYAGHASTDALGVMGQGEGILYTGTGSQAGVNRWGDYSSLNVDPSNDCTFWYTTEYNNSFNWYWGTRIGSFKFTNCTP